MLEALTKAIQERRYIAFSYSGIEREAQPAAVGVSMAGNEVLRCYQTAGGHVTPGHTWDLCDLSKLFNLRILDKTFTGNPPGYKRGDRGLRRIFAEL